MLDSLRGFTVILMIIFHFSFDLNLFGFVQFDIIREPFWYAFPRIIVFLFLFSSGMALSLAHQDNIKWKPFFNRLLLIIFWAVVISLSTYFLFPEHWIYFGTLHAIAVVSVMSLPFLKHPKTALLMALLLFIPSITLDKTLPWIELPHSSWDYISPFPWLGASLFGIFAAHKGFHKVMLPENTFIKSLNYLGKHSLFIYLVHQPILFGAFSLIMKLKRG
jgi:uncharacterized membrane protein